ncbi:MAG: SRPBCC family protein [Actinomycetota bacterium]|nr:SRPBCC family protein [Actinomycetota bacterium]
MEEQVAERMMVRATPEHCYEALIDYDSYPDWSADIKAVTVLERDDLGRGTKVSFRAAAFGRSTSLTLGYDYSQAPHRLSWVQEDGDLTRAYNGIYTFEASEDGDETEVTYQLTVELKVPLPGFVKRRAESRLVNGALRELKSRVEA